MTVLASRSGWHQLVMAVAVFLLPATAPGQPTAGPASEISAGIDSAAVAVLAATGAPSVTVAVVRDGAIFQLKAYGQAHLDPALPASATMRYPIGSVSKQFTAALLAMLADEGALSLDDPVARYFPELTRAGEITVRQLLSHTAGVRDYWPQDYLPAFMTEPVTTRALMDRWAREPLDFEPGTQYQYSNTGYVIAGAIVEKVTGRPLFELLRERIFTPLGMTSVVDYDSKGLEPGDPTGYMNYALGPQRPAPKEAPGWVFAAGGLAMTAADLARWDLALIGQSVLSPAAWRELTTEVRLASGVGAGYGLGLAIDLVSGRRVISHDGAVCGFSAVNRVYPEDRAAIVVIANHEGQAASLLADRIANLLFVAGSSTDARALEQVRTVMADLQRGTIDRSLLTPDLDAYFSAEALADFKAGLASLGTPTEVTFVRQGLRGGLTTRVYRASYGKCTLAIVSRTTTDGRFESFWVSAE